MVVANLDIKAYVASGSPSFYVAQAQVFSVNGMILPILNTGIGQPLSPVFLLAGFKVHIATPACASVGINSGKHLEGPVLVPDYSSFVVMPDGGTFFSIKPAWLGHFMGAISFAPIPLPPLP